jgi:hypothetical protein
MVHQTNASVRLHAVLPALGRVAALGLVLFCAAPPSPAAAAPFCITDRTYPPQCIYVDPNACREAAERAHAYCVANQTLTLSQTGTSAYCIVRSDQSKLCVYPDRNTCNVEAAREKSVCVDSRPNAGPTTAYDPFRLVRP